MNGETQGVPRRILKLEAELAEAKQTIAYLIEQRSNFVEVIRQLEAMLDSMAKQLQGYEDEP